MFVFYLGAKLIETVFYTAEITWRASSSIYGWYYPTLSDSEKMQLEFKEMKDEIKEVLETNKDLRNELTELKQVNNKEHEKKFVLV